MNIGLVYNGETMAVESSKTIPLGAPVFPFDLPSVDGSNYTVESFKDANILVVAFSCNHCPYAQAAWPLLIDLYNRFKDQDVAFVAINPNDKTQYPEDDFETMKVKAKEWGIPFPYLRDESQEVAHKYDARCTPDIYVYDQGRKLAYRGRINDNWQDPSKVTRHDLADALSALLRGGKPSKPQYPSMGCSIKWK